MKQKSAAKKMISDIKSIVQIPEGLDCSIDKRAITLSGPLGKTTKKLFHPLVRIYMEGANIRIMTCSSGKKGKRIVNTFKAHIINMIHGVKHGYCYKLKVCSSHFPMSVTQEKGYLFIKNFSGERVPRKARLVEGTKVSIEGQDILVEGIDKEAVGQTSANIEKATRRTGFDKRVFQDGIYLYTKE